MEKTKRAPLGQNTVKSKLFYALLLFIPTLQFIVFYIVVHVNSFTLAFKVFPDGTARAWEWDKAFSNFTVWFNADKVRFLSAISVSLRAYLISLIVGVPLGLFFSYYLFKRMPGAKFFRVILFMPSIISAAVLGVIYKMVTDNVVRDLLDQWFGLSVNFWGDVRYRFGTIMFFSVFVSFGTSVLMYTNKMTSIPPEMLESAQLDGASGIKEFWYIVLPQTYSIFTVFMIQSIAGCFSNQYSVMMLLDGGYSEPTDATPMGYMLWHGVEKQAGNVALMTPYAALGVMITVVIVPVTFLARYLLNRFGWKEE